MNKNLKDLKIFNNFCDLGVDRESIIIDILKRESVPYSVLAIGNARHIFVYPDNINLSRRVTVLVAHYDRVEGTHGANDNSASVFYLINHAIRLKKHKHSTVIIFTDKEEISSTNSVTDQGSYGLGKYFKDAKINNLDLFIFDMCGIGSTLILGKAGEDLIKKHYGDKYNNSKIHKDISNVKKVAEKTLLDINSGEFFYLTPLFSDDLGFILNDYPSVLISLLPYREAVEYKTNPDVLPKCWSNNHTIEDSVDTLDPKSWETLSPLLQKISGIERAEAKLKKGDFFFKCYTQNVKPQTKPILSTTNIEKYILKPLFSMDKMNSSNNQRIRTFLFYSSKLIPEAIHYIRSSIPLDTQDITFDLYGYLEDLVNKEFSLIPVVLRDTIYKKSGARDSNAVISYLYRNTLKNFSDIKLINTYPLAEKVKIKITVNETSGLNQLVRVTNNGLVVGTISLTKDMAGYIMAGGYFNPDLNLKLDPLNMLKGIRTALIKWVKLNNNSSLRINLNVVKWIGCYQLFNLIKIELEGRSKWPLESDLFYIWKRYNGKQS